MPNISAADLSTFAENLLKAGGALDEEARIVAESLVGANLRGHDSHGVMRIPFYLDRVSNGIIKPGAEFVVVQETPAVLVVDGNWGFGQVQSAELMRRLITKAEQVGIACGSLRQSAHIGRLGDYAEMAADAGMAAMVLANTHGAAQRVAPPGGIRPRLGTNPICLGMPGGNNGPFVVDFGTSITAEGKVRVKRIAGEIVPDGWLLDPDGNPTNDPNALYGDPPGTILPMGGTQPYKGFGLSFMIEMLCSGLSGAPCAHENPPPPIGNAAMFTVFNPRLFAGEEHLADEVAKLERYIREVPKAEGVQEITLPGDPERMVMAARSMNGITLDDGNWTALTDLAESLGVSVPSL